MGQDPDAIRQDLAQTRADMGETVDAVGDKADMPSRAREAVAAAWARMAGWIRTVGQVTPVVTVRLVVAAIPPITVHTNGLWPWLSFQGW